jgi:protein-tyrosine phosphatase
MRSSFWLLLLAMGAGCQVRHDVAASAAGGDGPALAPGGETGAPADDEAPVAGGAASGPEPGPCERSEFVLGASVKNARDLGGVPLEQGAVACRSLFRGPPLYGLSSLGCDQVASLGIKTVIDMRQGFERDSKPNSDCVGADQVFAPLPIPYELSAENYLAVLNAPAVADIFRTFAKPDAYPIYFHCTWGRDRTGVIGALLLLALGASRDDVLAEYMLSEDSVGAYPYSLAAVLDELEARGGAEAFLLELGLSEAEISALRERALAPQN